MAEAVVEPPIGCTGVVAAAWNRPRSHSPAGSDAQAHTPPPGTDEIRTFPDGHRERSPTPGDGSGPTSRDTSQCSKGKDVTEHQTQQESFTMDDDSETPPELEQAEHSSECAVCAGAGRLRCSGCLAAVYCSSAHQLEQWPAHRRLCRPYSVAYHPRLGRHLVATRALRRGDLILRDRPLMVGPCPETEPLCLGCYRPLDPAPAAVHRCSRCGWPLCSSACEHSSQHSAECEVTARCPLGRLTADEGEDWYPCVAVLRLLQLKDASPSDWPRLLELQSHDVERRGSEAYQLEQKLVVERVRNRFGQFQHSELLIHRVCGIMETNAYEIRLPEINVQGVYPRAALFQHDCVPNTHRTFDEDLTLVVRAAVDVAEGEHLTSIYTDNLWGTWQRREHLLNSKHFLCECARCSDPTELGTHLSSLRCSLCPDGYIQPVDPLTSDSDFACSSCGALVPGAPVRGALDGLQAEVEAVEEEPTITDCERLIEIISSVLHPTHHLMLDLKYPLVHLYNTSEPLPPTQLDRKEQLCREILTVADVLTPGISRLQGIVLYELQQTLLQKARALLKRKNSKSAEVVDLFKEARQRLREAISVLRWEPQVQPEGQLGLEAAEELAQLDSWLREHVPAAAPGSETSAKGGDSREPGVNGDERKRSDADVEQSGCSSAGANAGCVGASK